MGDMMDKLLSDMVKAIVDKPDEVDVTLTESENTKIYELRLGDGDVQEKKKNTLADNTGTSSIEEANLIPLLYSLI